MHLLYLGVSHWIVHLIHSKMQKHSENKSESVNRLFSWIIQNAWFVHSRIPPTVCWSTFWCASGVIFIINLLFIELNTISLVRFFNHVLFPNMATAVITYWNIYIQEQQCSFSWDIAQILPTSLLIKDELNKYLFQAQSLNKSGSPLWWNISHIYRILKFPISYIKINNRQH